MCLILRFLSSIACCIRTYFSPLSPVRLSMCSLPVNPGGRTGCQVSVSVCVVAVFNCVSFSCAEVTNPQSFRFRYTVWPPAIRTCSLAAPCLSVFSLGAQTNICLSGHQTDTALSLTCLVGESGAAQPSRS